MVSVPLKVELNGGPLDRSTQTVPDLLVRNNRSPLELSRTTSLPPTCCNSHPRSLLPASVQLAMPGTIEPNMLQPVPDTGSTSTTFWPVKLPPGDFIPAKLSYKERSVHTVALFAALKQLSLSRSIGTLMPVPLLVALNFTVSGCATPTARDINARIPAKSLTTRTRIFINVSS